MSPTGWKSCTRRDIWYCTRPYELLGPLAKYFCGTQWLPDTMYDISHQYIDSEAPPLYSPPAEPVWHHSSITLGWLTFFFRTFVLPGILPQAYIPLPNSGKRNWVINILSLLSSQWRNDLGAGPQYRKQYFCRSQPADQTENLYLIIPFLNRYSLEVSVSSWELSQIQMHLSRIPFCLSPLWCYQSNLNVHDPQIS